MSIEQSESVHATASHNQGERGGNRWALLQRHAALLSLVVAVLAGTVAFGGHFASSFNFHNILAGYAYLAIVAVGLTFVIISGGIDLSVGSVMALGAVLAGASATHGPVVALLVALGGCAVLGAVQGLLITRGAMAPFIVTLGGLLFARGLAFSIADQGNKVFVFPKGFGLNWLGQGKVLGVEAPVVIAAIIAVAGALLLNRTLSGQRVFAIGGAESSARLMGVPVERTKFYLYVASAVLAGLAGVIVATRQGSAQSGIQVGTELDAIAAVVIGGTLLTGGHGTLGGTIAGVVFLGVVQNLINQMNISVNYQQVVSGSLLIVVVAVQSIFHRLHRR